MKRSSAPPTCLLSMPSFCLQLVYKEGVVVGLLKFADALEACKAAPWIWADPQQRQPAPAPAGAHWPPLPAAQSGVADLVTHAFAAHGVPVRGTLLLPSGGLEVHCPGIAIQLPYRHVVSPDTYRHQPASSSGTAAPPAQPIFSSEPRCARDSQRRRDPRALQVLCYGRPAPAAPVPFATDLRGAHPAPSAACRAGTGSAARASRVGCPTCSTCLRWRYRTSTSCRGERTPGSSCRCAPAQHAQQQPA